MLKWYQARLTDGALQPDAAQLAAAQELQKFGDAVVADAAAAASSSADGWIQKLRDRLGGGDDNGGDDASSSEPTRGIYLHGGVGRGKTLLMDGFYLSLPHERKLRAHFHQFMRRLHEDMKANENRHDPLAHVAAGIGEKYDLICFDEFHVSDITDAMLLGRLLEMLINGGARFVMTSNYAPDGLYPNGLARERFLPAIALLKRHLRVVALSGEEDYRRSLLSQRPVYFSPWHDERPQQQMREAFARLAGGIELQANIKLGGRRIAAIARSSDCIWFDFATLCEQARGKNDYLQLAERFATVFVSAVPRLVGDNISEAARRFTWLVDILYDARARLVLGASEPLDALYGDGEGGESGRTLSRLIEMQSDAYGAAAGAKHSDDIAARA